MLNEVFSVNTIDREKLIYLLNHLDWYIENCVYDVLSDSVEDPEYSAVTTTNLIKCYIDIASSLQLDIPYHTVNEYLKEKCFTPEQIKQFTESRDRESVYYIGRQY